MSADQLPNSSRCFPYTCGMQEKSKVIERLSKIRDRISAELAGADGTSSPLFEKWRKDAEVAVRRAFGQESEEYVAFRNIGFLPGLVVSGMDSRVWSESFRSGLSTAEAQLASMIDQIAEYWPSEESVGESESAARDAGNDSKSVFLIHGHDSATRETVARTLEQLGLEPIILDEQSSGGRTIIEKLERHSSVSFAVVLLTKDDVGGKADDDAAGMKPRARQNVVFEFGYFIGQLGRERVCPLVEEGLEQPSDAHGVVYIPLDEQGGWRIRLSRELADAGFNVDANRLL